MKFKSGILSLVLLSGLTLAACSNGEEDHSDMDHDNPSSDEVRSLEVDLQTPESIQAGEPADFTAQDTRNEKDVSDGHKVIFKFLYGSKTLNMMRKKYKKNSEYFL